MAQKGYKSTKNKRMIRVSGNLIDELRNILDNEHTLMPNGHVGRTPKPFSHMELADATVVNLFLLTMMSKYLSEQDMRLFVEETSSMSFPLLSDAKEQLAIKETETKAKAEPTNNGPSVDNDLLTAMAQKMNSIESQQKSMATVLKATYAGQTQSDHQMIKDSGSILQLVSYLVALNSQDVLSDIKTYGDNATSMVKGTVSHYGEEHYEEFESNKKKS